MTKKQKRSLNHILVGMGILILGSFLPIRNPYLQLVIFLVAYAITGGDVIVKAANNIAYGQIFDEHLLMVLATFGAFVISDFHEGVCVMLFYQIGELFQSISVNRSRRSIAELMNIRPDSATVERNGKLLKVSAKDIAIGERLVIKPGEKVPLDGIIIEGHSLFDTKALTGESRPYEATLGDEILSGYINQTSLTKIRVQKKYEESTVAKILDLVENASSKKSHSEHFIKRFAKYYTPCIVIAATILAILPPLLFSHLTYSECIHRACMFLVISCPCALVISIPLSFFGGIGAASKQGILIKGSNYLEALAKTDTIVFDKTGTLTKGTFQVTGIHPIKYSEHELLEYAAMAEYFSIHPISKCLQMAYQKNIDQTKITAAKEIPGQGIKATIHGNHVLVGNEKLMRYVNNFRPLLHPEGTVLYVSINLNYAGYIMISDEIRSDAHKVIHSLRKHHVHKFVMLTGDQHTIGTNVAKKLGFSEVYTNLLPLQKVEKIETLLSKKASSKKLVYIGDGMNDAPVLSRADIGIAMGGIGSDAAIEAADIVLMTDDLLKISTAIHIARKTMAIVHQNIVFTLSVKILVLLLSTFGLSSMWAAVFADVGVSVIAILNAMRTLSFRKLT